MTAVTGGSLAPVFIGMGVSIASGGLIQGTVNALNGKSFWQGFADGMADGALFGGVFALGGAALRTVQIFKNGVVVGEGMNRVNQAARATGAATYKGMPGFKLVKAFKGAKYAENLALTHNKAFISRMTNWGVKFIDIGLDLGNVERTSRSIFYAAESQLLRNYWNYIFLS